MYSQLTSRGISTRVPPASSDIFPKMFAAYLSVSMITISKGVHPEFSSWFSRDAWVQTLHCKTVGNFNFSRDFIYVFLLIGVPGISTRVPAGFSFPGFLEISPQVPPEISCGNPSGIFLVVFTWISPKALLWFFRNSPQYISKSSFQISHGVHFEDFLGISAEAGASHSISLWITSGTLCRNWKRYQPEFSLGNAEKNTVRNPWATQGMIRNEISDVMLEKYRLEHW